MGLKMLAGIASNENAPAAARVSAVGLLLDRGWGKAPQAHTGENGENDVRITIRNITETANDRQSTSPSPRGATAAIDLDPPFNRTLTS
jgi:hypothetical protein